MAYLTDRKRASGLGSAKSGTEHHWYMIVSAVGLIGLVPTFIFTFGPMLGRPHEEVVAYFAKPFPAIVAALTIFVALLHFKNGVRIMIEDYVQGTWRRVLIIAMVCITYTAGATGLFAIARLAF